MGFGRPSIARCWETFMVVLVAYSAWVYPFEVAFMNASPKGGLEGADIVVDLFFTVDIVLTFFVAYIDPRTQLLVRDRKKIALRYARLALASCLAHCNSRSGACQLSKKKKFTSRLR